MTFINLPRTALYLATNVSFESAELMFNQEQVHQNILTSSKFQNFTIPAKSKIQLKFNINLNQSFAEKLRVNNESSKPINLKITKLKIILNNNIPEYFINFNHTGKPLVKTKKQRRSKDRVECRECYKLTVLSNASYLSLSRSKLSISNSRNFPSNNKQNPKPKLQYFEQILNFDDINKKVHFSEEYVILKNYEFDAISKIKYGESDLEEAFGEEICGRVEVGSNLRGVIFWVETTFINKTTVSKH